MKNALIILIILIMSCSKDDGTWYSYAETGCADEWMSYPHTSDDELADAVKKYLKDQDINVSIIKVSFDSSRIGHCFACFCTTGRIIDLISSEENEAVLKEIGFISK